MNLMSSETSSTFKIEMYLFVRLLWTCSPVKYFLSENKVTGVFLLRIQSSFLIFWSLNTLRCWIRRNFRFLALDLAPRQSWTTLQMVFSDTFTFLASHGLERVPLDSTFTLAKKGLVGNRTLFIGFCFLLTLPSLNNRFLIL